LNAVLRITTLIGGAVFLIPFVIALLVVEKAIGIMKVIAQPLARWIAVDTDAGIALANFIALLSVIIICFLAGLFARGAWVRKTFSSWESSFLMKIPGYALIKGVKDVFDPDTNGNIRAALLQLGDVQRIGYEIERISENRSVVFLPLKAHSSLCIMKVLHSVCQKCRLLNIPA